MTYQVAYMIEGRLRRTYVRACNEYAAKALVADKMRRAGLFTARIAKVTVSE